LSTEGDGVVTSILEEYLAEIREDGLAKGPDEGRLFTLRQGDREVPEVRFPKQVSSFADRIDAMKSADVLHQLHRVSLTAASVSEIDQWIKSRG